MGGGVIMRRNNHKKVYYFMFCCYCQSALMKLELQIIVDATVQMKALEKSKSPGGDM